MRQQGKIIKKMKEEITGLTEDYSGLLKYKSLDWNIAAFYRIGLLRQLFSKALYNIPLPKGLSPEEEDIYITQIEEIAIPIEDDAVQRFETAYQKAREFRISNEWTRKVLLSLNQYKPAEYPTFKDEKRLEVRELYTTSQLLMPKGARELLKGSATPEAQGGSADEAAPAEQSSPGTTRGQRSAKLPPEPSAAPSAAPSAPDSAPPAPSAPPQELEVEEIDLVEE